MTQIEIFCGQKTQDIQSRVNTFIAKLPSASVVQILQSESMSSKYGWMLTITVVYKERSQG